MTRRAAVARGWVAITAQSFTIWTVPAQPRTSTRSPTKRNGTLYWRPSKETRASIPTTRTATRSKGSGRVSGKRVRQRGARIMGGAALPPTPSGSGDADVLRASQLLHAVEHVDRHAHLGRPTLLRMRAQPVADHLLPSANGGLGLGAFRVPGRCLPGHAPVVGHVLEVAVALRRRALRRLARHRGRARRHDDGRLGVALGDAGVNTILVVSAITRERGHRSCHLVEQGTDLRTVIYILGGQRCGDDLAGVGVHAEMKLAPRPSRLG